MTKTGALAGIHVAAVLFGFAGLFPRWLGISAPHIVLGRTFFAALFLLLLLRLRGPFPRRPPPKQLLAFVLSGMLLALHWVAFFRAIDLSSVAVGLLAFSCFPAFLVLLEPLFFKEKFRPANLLLVGITLVGVFLIKPGAPGELRLSPGLAWGLASGFTFALLILINRGLARTVPALQITFWQDLFAFFALTPYLLLAPVRFSGRSILLLLALGVLCTAVAHSLFIRGLKLVSGQTAGLIALAEPVYAILLALLLLGEIPSLRTVAGGVMILAAAAWATARPENP